MGSREAVAIRNSNKRDFVDVGRQKSENVNDGDIKKGDAHFSERFGETSKDLNGETRIDQKSVVAHVCGVNVERLKCREGISDDPGRGTARVGMRWYQSLIEVVRVDGKVLVAEGRHSDVQVA